jgi:hypothetical protein
MTDLRARHFRQLRRLRRSARRWSVLAGTLGGAAAVLTPYHGIGLGDAVWAAAAGGAAMFAGWRWSDARALGAQPAPPPPDPAVAAERTRRRLMAMVARIPAGRTALDEIGRAQTRLSLRGTAVVGAWSRLDRASVTLAGLSGRLGGPAESAMLEATAAERALRDLADRAARVEKAIRLAPADARSELEQSHQVLIGQLDDGVAAYERLVAAAAGYVAEDGRGAVEHPSVSRLAEATDLLRGVAAGLSELRNLRDPLGNLRDPLSTG